MTTAPRYPLIDETCLTRHYSVAQHCVIAGGA